MASALHADPKTVELFETSLQRLLDEGDFLALFYERFMGASEVVREKFGGTDLEKQKEILRASLFLVARAAVGKKDGVAHLESVARSHARRQLDISPSLYSLWLDTLVSTAKAHDPKFCPKTEMAWRQLLGWSIQKMVEVYQAEQTVPPPQRRA